MEFQSKWRKLKKILCAFYLKQWTTFIRRIVTKIAPKKEKKHKQKMWKKTNENVHDSREINQNIHKM